MSININIKARYQSPSHIAIMIWQVLFNEYRAGNGDLDHIDSLLCDLLGLREMIELKAYTLYWAFDKDYTVLQGRPILVEQIASSYYRITIDFSNDNIYITRLENI